MFNIPELDCMISRLLNQSDLACAAQVLSKWNSGLGAYVWTAIPAFTMNSRQHISLYMLVVEDYVYEKRKEEAVKEEPCGSGSQCPASQRRDPPALTKYGGRVSRILCPSSLLLALSTPPSNTTTTTMTTTTTTTTATSHAPSGEDLFLHILKKCPSISKLSMSDACYRSDEVLHLMTPIFSKIKELNVSYNHQTRELATTSRLRKMMSLLPELEKLGINIGKLMAGGDFEEEICAKPKVLEVALEQNHVLADLRAIKWLWPCCSDLHELRIRQIPTNVFQSMSGAMGKITKLESLALGNMEESKSLPGFTDRQVASIIRAHRSLQSVALGQIANVGVLTTEVLSEMDGSLQDLTICQADARAKLTSILASCQLRSFDTVRDRTSANIAFPTINAKDMIDHQDDGTLREWKSEPSLQMLSIRIGSIGQAVDPHAPIATAACQKNVMYQIEICSRLARFTSLAVLRLGHISSANPRIARHNQQTGCLQLTLLTGLRQLETLTNLIEFNVSEMRHAIGVAE
ncbi:hypothetical protein BG005_002811, partial [Podila minutissima]